MEHEIGQCGICGVEGPLEEIQRHVLIKHKIENDDSDHSDHNDVSLSDESILRWPRAHVLLLIRLVENKSELFQSSTLKKHVWANIATEITKTTGKMYTPGQVDNKWKGLKKTYKNIKDNNKKSGQNAMKWEFFYAMDTFMKKKPEVSPLAVCSSSSGLKVLEVPTEDSCANLSTLGETSDKENITPTSIRKRKRTEDINKKRHDEKLARFDEFLKLYRASVEHQTGKKVE